MNLDDEKVSNDQGCTEILGGQPEVEMHDNSFDESQDRFVHPNRVPTAKDQTSPAQVEKQVIVADVHKDPVALANATRVYAEAIKSSVRFLIVVNERMVKEL